MHTNLLITDFDGTLTKIDFFERVLAEYSPPKGFDAWDKYLEGNFTQFEALAGIFACVPDDEETVMRLARSVELEPDLKKALEQLDQRGWDVWVASTGSEWYIERLLAERGIHLRIISNRGELQPGGGLRLIAPVDSPYYTAETGIDKAAVVREGMSKYARVAFAGNGRADKEALKLCAPELRFATGWLADDLTREGTPFHRFNRWSEVAARLVSE